jgi:hypothetical protein
MVPVEIAETIKRRGFFGCRRSADTPAVAPQPGRPRYDN